MSDDPPNRAKRKEPDPYPGQEDGSPPKKIRRSRRLVQGEVELEGIYARQTVESQGDGHSEEGSSGSTPTLDHVQIHAVENREGGHSGEGSSASIPTFDIVQTNPVENDTVGHSAEGSSPRSPALDQIETLLQTPSPKSKRQREASLQLNDTTPDESHYSETSVSVKRPKTEESEKDKTENIHPTSSSSSQLDNSPRAQSSSLRPIKTLPRRDTASSPSPVVVESPPSTPRILKALPSRAITPVTSPTVEIARHPNDIKRIAALEKANVILAKKVYEHSITLETQTATIREQERQLATHQDVVESHATEVDAHKVIIQIQEAELAETKETIGAQTEDLEKLRQEVYALRGAVQDEERYAECCICLEVMHRPHQMSQCGHTACAACAVAVLEGKHEKHVLDTGSRSYKNATKCFLCKRPGPQSNFLIPNLTAQATVDRVVTRMTARGDEEVMLSHEHKEAGWQADRRGRNKDIGTEIFQKSRAVWKRSDWRDHWGHPPLPAPNPIQPPNAPLGPPQPAPPQPAQPANVNPFAQALHGNPFAQLAHVNPFAQPAHINPFAQPAQANPFAQLAQANPFAQPAHANAFAQAAHGNPFAQLGHVNLFAQPAHDNPFAPAVPNAQGQEDPAVIAAHPPNPNLPVNVLGLNNLAAPPHLAQFDPLAPDPPAQAPYHNPFPNPFQDPYDRQMFDNFCRNMSGSAHNRVPPEYPDMIEPVIVPARPLSPRVLQAFLGQQPPPPGPPPRQ